MKKPVKTQEGNTIYALHYKGKLIGTFNWGGGCAPNLQGWRPPKKVYFKLGLARSGATHLPQEILDDVEIVEYGPTKVIERLSSRKLEVKRLKTKLKYRRDCLNYPNISKSWKVTYEKEIGEMVNRLRELGLSEEEISPPDEGRFEI